MHQLSKAYSFGKPSLRFSTPSRNIKMYELSEAKKGECGKFKLPQSTLIFNI